jgi:hypothetical protein
VKSPVKMFQCSKLPCLGWRSADFLQGFFCPKCLQEQLKNAHSSTKISMEKTFSDLFLPFVRLWTPAIRLWNLFTLTKRKKISWTRAGWPDWANFRLLGDCFLRAVSRKLRK